MNHPTPALRALALLCTLPGLAALALSQQGEDTVHGERLTPEMIGETRTIDMLELHRFEQTLDHDTTFIQRARNGAQGEWTVPSSSSSESAHSGRHYLVNKWGDASMGIGFGGSVDLVGAWVAGQESPGAWAEAVRVIGYREGREVASSSWFEIESITPSWFAMDLAGVDRVVFEARTDADGSGWYAVDDLTFVRGDARVVLDFEQLAYKQRLTGTGFAGLTWEVGTGEFHEVKAIEQPLTAELGGRPGDLGDEGAGDDDSFFGGGGTAPNLIQQFDGPKIFDPGAGFIPPDTCGAVGINHFVTVVNTNFSVFNKSNGARVVNVSMANFFGVGGNPGDPRIVFDPHSQRWFVLATNFNDRIYVAASTSSDPTGSFFTSSFLTSQGSDSGRFPDYETLGVDQNGVYTAAAMFGSQNATMTIFALDKAPLIAGSPSIGTITAFRGMPFEGAIQPCVTYGTPPGEYFISLNSTSSFRFRRLNPPLTSPTLTNLGTIGVPGFSEPPDAPSQGAGTPLDSVSSRHMNAVYRNGSVWTAHAVNSSGRAAARWYEINASGASLVQMGTTNSSTLSYIIPSIAVNAANDVVMGFTGSSSSQFAGAYYTGRRASDPAGQMATPIQYKAGEASYENNDGIGRNRWGDYSLVSIDPVDDSTFWMIQEYADSPANRWATRVAELAYPPGFTDCNGNGVDDAMDIANGTSQDCNGNAVPDECDISGGASNDCDNNGVPDECQADCNNDGTPDVCDPDCNGNGQSDLCETQNGNNDCNNNDIPDDCDIAGGASDDCNGNGLPDECEFVDCNGNGVLDACDIASGSSDDCDGNGVPDECQADCNNDGTPDVCDPDCNNNNDSDLCEIQSGFADDCNNNGVPDECDIASGSSQDCNNNGRPDECDPNDCNGNGVPDDCEQGDCNGNGVLDECDIASGTSQDCNGNGTPDECEPNDCNGNGVPDDCEQGDCNGNGVLDECDIASGTSQDCNGNGTPDECESNDCNGNGIPDDCEQGDCNANGVLDECDIAAGTSDDCNGNGVPDECELVDCNGNGVLDECDIAAGTSDDCNGNGVPDECELVDCNGNGVLDECDIAAGASDDCNGNGVPDECELVDCNGNGVLDECDIAGGTSADGNGNGIPDECEMPGTNYCVAAPNSAGPGAIMGATGSNVVANNDLVLTATASVPGGFGIFFYGPNQVQTPFGDGFRCVGGLTQRLLPPLQANGMGNVSRAVDNSSPPVLGDIVPSANLNFQWWYRDPMGPGGTGFNLSDGLNVVFQ